MAVKRGVLSYNGTTYRLSPTQVRDLLARGIIVADPMAAGVFELAREHTIDEIGAGVAVVEYQTGAEARGEGDDVVRQKMLSVRYMHRDGQGGAH